jgi:hypothetical protein
MKNKRLAFGLSLMILIAFSGNGLVMAKGGAATQPARNNIDPVESQNTNDKGLKSPQSARKQAAKRLKQDYQQEQEQELQNWVKKHHGYTGQGQAGIGLDSNLKPSMHRGGK